MGLVEQWKGIEDALDPRWATARVALSVAPAERRNRAAALLAPAGPGLSGETIRFAVSRHGGGIGPEAVRRMLRRIDEEGIGGTVELVGTDVATSGPAVSRPSPVSSWDVALSQLPADWSDLLCELELASSTDVDRAAVLLGPLNLRHDPGRRGFRFRVARTRGFGASEGMVRRCLERLAAERVDAAVRVLDVFCDTHPVGTQGPVWQVGGRVV